MTIRKFTVPEVPANERERQATLDSYRIAELRSHDALEALVAEASTVFSVPTVLVSIVDRDVQWFPAKVGMPLDSTPRSISFCGHAIHQDEPLVVPDATQDERFAGNPLVIEPGGLRFYAGAPLRTSDGFRIGTLCLIDSRAHAPLDDGERRRLSDFAGRAMAIIEAQRKS